MPQNADWTTRKLDYEPPRIDTGRAHMPRVYDYFLGGKDNYLPDRELGERMIKVEPSIPESLRHNRWFMHRATRYLAAEEGISQFLDLGTGIPTSPNLHEVAQQANPAARVVYVDNDPIVIAHMYARLTSSPRDQVGYLHADIRDPEAILTAPELTAVLDLSRPAAVLILAVLYEVVADADEARELLSRYVAALAPGSFLALSVVTFDGYSRAAREKQESVLREHGFPSRMYTRAEAVGLFDGLELVEPGVVLTHQWRPDAGTPEVRFPKIGLYCGVARKA
jgi:S-adenosyl methyltransferase